MRKATPRHVDIHLARGTLRVQPIAPHTFRIRLRPDDNWREPALTRYGILRSNWPKTQFSVEDGDAKTVIRTAEAELSVSKSDGRIELKDAKGGLLLRETAPPVSGPGFAAEFELSPDERLYGLGDENRDIVAKRGHRTMMWVQDCISYAPIPFLMSTRGWAVLVNSTWRHAFDIGSEKPDRVRFWAPRGELDYYLFTGHDLPALLDRYTEVAGKPTLLPLWAYGLTFVCNTRATARDMLDECLRFRGEGLPCDVIGLEPGWMEHCYDTSAETDWHPENFHIADWHREGKHDGTFVSAAGRLGFKLSLWLACEWDVSHYEEELAGAKSDEANWFDEFRKKDYGEFSDPHMRPTLMDHITKRGEPWFEHLKKFVDQGACSFKMDGCGVVNVHPDRKWGNGMDDEEFHNLYPLLLNKQMSLGFREHTGRRPMVYTSAAYTSIQKYSATWAGDTGGGHNALVSMLNHGLSGHSNTSCDMHVYTPEGIHFGFLQPWSQINSWITWDQPWFLGDKLGPIFEYYSRLRYRLLPYIYSMAHVAARTALPIMRAMPLAYPDDPRSDELLHQYMFGDAMLVAAFTDSVHLPEGRWIDFWTGQEYQGPLDLTCHVPEDRGGPLFIRGGAIIPHWPDMDYVGQKPLDTLTLHVYPSGESSFTLYEDDGVTFGYLDNAVATTTITCAASDRGVQISIGPRAGSYDGMPESRTFAVHVHGKRSPAQVFANGEALRADEWSFDGREICLTVSEDARKQKAAEIRCVWADPDSTRRRGQ